MQTNIVLTLTGADRVGLVEEVTRLLVQRGGNIETSRMTQLGGAFAMLMLVSLPAEQMNTLDAALEPLTVRGYKFTVSQTEQAADPSQAGWTPYEIEVVGADHEGIIYQVAQTLAQRGINIASMDTHTMPAPMSGDPLFTMKARVYAPPSLAESDWRAALDAAGQQLNVDVAVASKQQV